MTTHIRIRSYLPDGTFTSCEHLYRGYTQASALARFRQEYPEHNKCILVAEDYDCEDPKNAEHFKACKACGCVHFF